MKHFLPLTLASVMAVSATAAELTGLQAQVSSKASEVKVMKGKPRSLAAPSTNAMKSLADLQAKTGVKMRRFPSVSHNKINPLLKRVPKKAATAEGVLLWESFEDYDPDTEGWLPEGWSSVSKGDSELEANATWHGGQTDETIMTSTPDGNCFMEINYSLNGLPQDEWLMTPEVTLEGNELLSFQLFSQPLFFFNLDETIDWDRYQWIVEPELIGDVTVAIKIEGGEWQQIWSLMDNYKGYGVYDLSMATGFTPYSVSLAEYAGKKVQFAFNYKGTNCDTVFLDCVSVSLPSFDDISYMAPLETLYWGFDNSTDMVVMNMSVAQYPVYSPLTFSNNTSTPATYSWSYHDPVTNDWATSNEQEMLQLTYAPDYTSEFTRRNNMYYPPVLHGVAPGTSAGSYTMPVNRMQAGGKAEFMATKQDGSKQLYNFGLLPFDVNTDGSGITLIDAPSVGDFALPVFGYNCNTDKYWLDYTLGGEKPSEGDEVKMVSILNFIYSQSAPMILNGVNVNAFGNMDDDAELTVQIIPCDESYTVLEDEVLASATCTFKDMQRADIDYPYLLLNIPFKFDKPVVLDNSRPAYLVKLSGFNSDKVETFIPFQSMRPNRDYLCHGWIEKKIKIDSDYFRNSYTPMAYVEGNYGDCYNAFSINLDACYPWLDCETEEVTVSSDGTPVEVNLGSYYDGSELTVDAPAGIIAKAEGRYNECVLTISHDDTAVVAKGDITVSAPGVKAVIKVSEGSSVDKIESDGAHGEIVAVYGIDGRSVKAADAKSGVYIVKYADGTTRKAVLK